MTTEISAVQRQTWTVLSMLRWAAEDLEKRGIESPRLTVELLLCRTLACDRLALYTGFDRPLASAELAAFKEMFKRKIAREPVQYILGETEFMGLKFKTDPRALIPRPETEILVEEAVRCAKAKGVGSILDIGTGSGNIAVALAWFLPAVRVESVDASEEALALAGENAKLVGVGSNLTLLKEDLFDPGFSRSGVGMIVSNPPYVSAAEMAELAPEIRDYEPRGALTDGSDGLRFYRKIAELAPRLLAPGGFILLEVGAGQAEQVAEMFGPAPVALVKDYQKIERVVRIGPRP